MFPRCVWTVFVCLAGVAWVVQPEVATAQAVSSGDSVAGASIETQAITIGLDMRHDPPEHPEYGLDRSNFSQFRSTITGIGYGYQFLASFLPSDLAGLDALVLYTPPAAYGPGFTSAEISAIQAYVQAGGGLLVIGECFTNGENVNGLNQILSPYGVEYSPLCHDVGVSINEDFWYHPLTRGLHSVIMLNQLGMTFAAPALDMTVHDSLASGFPEPLAAWEGDSGTGKVVCITDSHVWCNSSGDPSVNIYAADNLLLLQNVLQFIVGQNPYECGGPTPAAHFRSVFESSDECWTQVSTAGTYEEPGFSRAEGGLGLSPDGSFDAFGYWTSPVLSVEPGVSYFVYWVVQSTTAAQLCPQFRLRINDTLGRDAVYRAVESRMAGENSPGTSDREYSILYNASTDAISEISLSFDLLSFSPDDDLNSTVRLKEVGIIPFVYTDPREELP